RCFSGAGATRHVSIRHRRGYHRLLKQAVEQQTARAGSTAVEAEYEFVQVMVELRRLHGPMVSTQYPTLDQRGDPMHSRHRDVCRYGATQYHHRFMRVAMVSQVAVSRRAIGTHTGTRLDDLFHEGQQMLLGTLMDALQADTSEAFRIEDFDGHGHQRLGGIALSSCGGSWGLPIRDGNVGFVNLDAAMQMLAPRPHHGATQAMEHRPRRLVTVEPQHALQPQRTDALLLIGHVPSCGQPHPPCFDADTANTSSATGWLDRPATKRHTAGR